MKVRDLLNLLLKDGWHLHAQRGSHRQFVHQTKKGKVTLAGHPTDEVHPKTLSSILRQAGLKD